MKLRRTAFAFALSFVINAAMVIALCFLAKEKRPAVRERPKPAIKIALIPWRPAPPPLAPKAAAPTRKVVPAPGSALAAPARKPRPVPKEGLASAPAASPHAPAASPHTPAVPDAPRALKLTPDPLPFAASGPVPQEESGGHTIHNVPEELPDPEAVAAKQAQEAKARVDGWITDELATLRVENGLVDSWFTDMHKALEKGVAHPPPFKGKSLVQEMARSWLDSLQQYGKSGNPYASGAQPDPPLLGGVPTPLERQAERFRGSSAEAFQHTLEAGSRLRDLGDGKFGSGLVAVVEIRQSSQGKLLGTVLLESSGNKLFDAYVLKSAPVALDTLPAPPANAPGVHPDGIRSTWAFEGRITYKKKLSDMHLAQDGWYLAGLLPLSMLTGHFEETTGEVEVIDLRNPEFTCKVRLLKVY